MEGFSGEPVGGGEVVPADVGLDIETAVTVEDQELEFFCGVYAGCDDWLWRCGYQSECCAHCLPLIGWFEGRKAPEGLSVYFMSLGSSTIWWYRL